MANNLLETYTSDKIIAEIDGNIFRFSKPLYISPLELAKKLAKNKKTLMCPHVYNKYVPKRMLVEGLLQSESQIMRSWCSSYKTSPIQNLAYHARGKNSQAEARWQGQPQKCSNIQQKANLRQFNGHWGTINYIGWSSIPSLKILSSKSGKQVSTEMKTIVTLSNKFNPTTVNMMFRTGYMAHNPSRWLLQLHGASKYLLLPGSY